MKYHPIFLALFATFCGIPVSVLSFVAGLSILKTALEAWVEVFKL
jgi:hypothetical protein